MQYRPDIDGLRAVAILPVVLYHAGFPGVTGGFIGVDVFFVISGFLITSIVATEIAENRFSLLGFYERRARRIVPALTIVVAATLVTGSFVLLPDEFKELGQSALAAALFLSNVYFVLELDYFAPAAEFAPLLHTWSLAVEEQFYLFFPILLIVLIGRWGCSVAVWAVLGMSLLSLVASIALLSYKPDWVFYQIFFRIWELGVGALLALYRVPVLGSRLLRELVGCAGLIAILVSAVAYDQRTPFPGLAALPPVLGAAALIYIGSSSAGSIVTKALSFRLFVWIGLISYSLYLWHWPVLAVLRIVREDVHLPFLTGLLAVIASVVLAWLSYRFVEQPFRAKGSRGFSQKTILSASVCALLSIVVVGRLLYTTDGLPNRISPEIIAIGEVVEDENPDVQKCFDKLPSEGLCSLGLLTSDRQTYDFLFWGDSHAEAMRSGVHLAAQTAGKSGLFAGTIGCLPVPQIQRSPERRRCTEMNQSVWHLLQERSDVSTVILAARWVLWVEGTRYRQEAGSRVVLEWAGASEAKPMRQGNAPIFEAGLSATVEGILATGRRVIIIGPTPEVGWNVPRTLARVEMLGPIIEAPGLTETAFLTRAGKTERLLSKLATEDDRVNYIPLSDLFCGNGICAVTDQHGLPLYRDDDHISYRTAQSLLPDRLSAIWPDDRQ